MMSQEEPTMLKATLVAATALALLTAGTAGAQEIRLMTGPQGGVWVPLGGQLKDLWEKAVPGARVQALPGAGIANVRGIQEAKAEVGFGNSISTVDALVGNPPFNKPHTNVCNVATLYPQYFQMLVPTGAGIEKVADLKGKSITTQPRGNTGELITQQLLKAHGLSYNDVKVSFVSYTDSVEQMKDGHAQAFTLGTAIPSGAVMDLASAREVRLLDLSGSLPAMKKMNPGYTHRDVPEGHLSQAGPDVQ
jgi:TRAP transporter TAXI family solute receptor